MTLDPKQYRQTIVDNMVEIEPLDDKGFLKVKETLTRMGIPSRRDDEELPILWQSCHVLHKGGRYFIVHFKELFLLDGKTSSTDFNDEDKARRNQITELLEAWNLVKPLKPLPDVGDVEIRRVKVIPFKERKSWLLKSKYSIGVNVNKDRD